MNPAWWPPLLLAIPGALAARRWVPGLGLPAQLGLGILLGLAGAPLLLFLAHILGLPLARIPVLSLLGVSVSVLTWWLWPRKASDARSSRTESTPWLPVEIVVLALIVGLVLASAWKGAFYPISATDAHAYDGRARWIVAEKTLALSVYDTIKASGATNISYPPVHSLDLALGYWVGAPQGKVVDSWFFGGILLVLYGVLRPRLPRIGALMGTLILAGTPEIWNHASLALINLPSMAFLSAGFLLALWLSESGSARAGGGAWWLAGILAAGAAGTRTDAMLLILGGALLLLLIPERGRWVRGVALVLPALVVTLLWQFYLKYRLGLLNSEPFRSDLMAPPIIILKIALTLLDLLTHPPLLGYTFHLLALALLATGLGRATRATWAAAPLAPAGRHVALVCVWGITLIAVFQALDPRFGGGIKEIMETSFKRTSFYLVPPAIAALMLLPPVHRGWTTLDRWQRSAV